ncbi:hypothetical protein Tco_1243718 [Tanacetum coccineum]
MTVFREIATLALGDTTSVSNNSKDLGKLKAKADIGIFVGYAPNRKGYRIYNNRTQQIKETIHVQFDELTGHMDPVHIIPPAPAVQVPVVLASTPFSKTINQDAPSTSHSSSSSEVQAPSLQQGVAAGPTFKDNPFAYADNNLFVIRSWFAVSDLVLKSLQGHVLSQTTYAKAEGEEKYGAKRGCASSVNNSWIEMTDRKNIEHSLLWGVAERQYIGTMLLEAQASNTQQSHRAMCCPSLLSDRCYIESRVRQFLTAYLEVSVCYLVDNETIISTLS